jgi:hypothetical protein
MPLIATNRPMILIAQTPWVVGFWIHIVGSTPPDFVWVVATHQCVEDLKHPNEIADQHNALAIAETNRALLERTASASAKFDKEGLNPDDGVQEKKPVLKLHSHDLPG